MATNPTPRMTVEQLKQELAMYEDMVDMLNSGISKAEIGQKYGHYPDSTKEAVVTINAIKTELVKRGEIVEGLPDQEYSTARTIIVLGGVILVAVIILALIGKYQSLKQ
jgi:hypothetical protein